MKRSLYLAFGLLGAFIYIGFIHFSPNTVQLIYRSNSSSLDYSRDYRDQRIEKQLRNHRAALETLSCASRSIGLRGGFCLTRESLAVGGNNWWDLPLSRKLEKIFANQTVGDFGAGLGWYGKFFLRRWEPIFFFNSLFEEENFNKIPGIKKAMAEPQQVKSWTGFDGAGNIHEFSGGFIQYLDLSEEVDLGEQFDWVLSLEVGEHIPRAFETVFIDNLDRHARKGIILSWAVEGQGGHHHVNNRNNDYVKKVMDKRGFENLIEVEQELRKNVKLSWFENTIMVFQRK